MLDSSDKSLSEAQNELYLWIKEYMIKFQHSPSIRQMMEAMGLKSPAPIQSRLKHLQQKDSSVGRKVKLELCKLLMRFCKEFQLWVL